MASHRDAVACEGCGREFERTDDGILSLIPLAPKPLPAAYDDPDYRRMSAFFDDSNDYFTDANPLFRAIHESSHRTIRRWRAHEAAHAKAAGDGWTLDLGCGQGYHWDYFGPDRTRLVGVDIRMESLRSLRRRFPGGYLVQAHAAHLPFADATFDEVISIYALEHVFHLTEAVAEMDRLLAPDGRCYVGLPCEGGLAWMLGRKLTSERTMSKRYNVDYRKYITLEHCNTARAAITALNRHPL